MAENKLINSKNTFSFNQKKTLLALQGNFVITDENQHFEWVGSQGAGPCIIILIHAEDINGNKVAACGHLSAAENLYSVNHMMARMNAKKILSVHLISGYTAEDDQDIKLLVQVFREAGVEKIGKNLNQGIMQGALNVHTGQVIYNEINLTIQNAGKNSTECLTYYALEIQFNILLHKHRINRPGLKLSIDARKPEDSYKVLQLLENAIPPYQKNKFSFMDILSLAYRAPIYLITSEAHTQKCLMAPPEKMLITHPEWEDAKLNLLYPRISLNEHRFFSKAFFSTNKNLKSTKCSSSNSSINTPQNHGPEESYCGFKKGFLIGKRF